MKNKISEKVHNIEHKIVDVLDRDKNGVVEPSEVVEVLKDVSLAVLELKGLIKLL